MSRLRVGHKPDDWRIEEPRQGRLSTQGFIVRGAPIEYQRPRHKFGSGNVEKGLSPASRNPDDEVVQAPSIEVPQ